jgi:hypothetical protein
MTARAASGVNLAARQPAWLPRAPKLRLVSHSWTENTAASSCGLPPGSFSESSQTMLLPRFSCEFSQGLEV